MFDEESIFKFQNPILFFWTDKRTDKPKGNMALHPFYSRGHKKTPVFYIIFR